MSQKETNTNFSTLLRKIKNKPLDRELGFGNNITEIGRLMNPDGTFNVQRQHVSLSDNVYYYLITMPWSGFFLLMLTFFVVLNSVFAAIYCQIGVDQFSGITPGSWGHNFTQAYFFSSQTLTTVGYGHISPQGMLTSTIASFESFLGLLSFALVSGLLYGRFSRPKAKIVFSERLLAAPYKTGQALMFRMGNASKSELIETEVMMLMAFNQRNDDGSLNRKFYTLNLEISKISFFTLSWTLVHPLDENSPIFNFSLQDLVDANAEFMVLVKGTDETAQQIVHTRHSYTANEIVWNARFKPVIGRNRLGMPHLLTRDIGLHEVLS